MNDWDSIIPLEYSIHMLESMYSLYYLVLSPSPTRQTISLSLDISTFKNIILVWSLPLVVWSKVKCVVWSFSVWSAWRRRSSRNDPAGNKTRSRRNTYSSNTRGSHLHYQVPSCDIDRYHGHHYQQTDRYHGDASFKWCLFSTFKQTDWRMGFLSFSWIKHDEVNRPGRSTCAAPSCWCWAEIGIWSDPNGY